MSNNNDSRDNMFSSLTGLFGELRQVAEQYKKKLKVETEIMEIFKKKQEKQTEYEDLSIFEKFKVNLLLWALISKVKNQ